SAARSATPGSRLPGLSRAELGITHERDDDLFQGLRPAHLRERLEHRAVTLDQITTERVARDLLRVAGMHLGAARQHLHELRAVRERHVALGEWIATRGVDGNPIVEFALSAQAVEVFEGKAERVEEAVAVAAATRIE